MHGLWDALRSRGLLEEAKNGEELRQLLQGKKVAVDLSIWAVEGQERSLQIEAKGGNIWPKLLPPHVILPRSAVVAV